MRPLCGVSMHVGSLLVLLPTNLKEEERLSGHSKVPIGVDVSAPGLRPFVSL